MGERNSVLTEKEKQEAFDAYRKGESGTSIAKRYGVYPNSIYGLMKRRGIKRRNISEAHRKYKINEKFFNSIDSEEKAYILGLFYADGSNNIKRYKAYIMLAEQDVDILYKIKDLIQPEKPLHYQKRKPQNSKHQNRYMFYIDNKHISKQLEKLGCVINKTYKLKFPDWLDENLYNHFIRGYFDGDGHIGIYNKRAQISITGTKEFLNRIKNILTKININCKLYERYPERRTNIRSIQFNGNRQVERFLNWLYKDSTLYIERKYDKYKELIELNNKTSIRKNK